MSKFIEKFNKPKFFLIIIFVTSILSFMFFEIKQQWQEQENCLTPYEILEKIDNLQPYEIKQISIFPIGGSTFRNHGYYKIIVETEDKNIFYARADHDFLFHILYQSTSKRGDTNAILTPEKLKKMHYLTNWENFKLMPFTYIFGPILGILGSLGSFLWALNLYHGTVNRKRLAVFETDRNKKKVLFKDVAGCIEEKEELSELVDFLKKPRKYIALGATIPKGILLSGYPGTGKTLLAKALAGEAGVSFYAISGSDFESNIGNGVIRVKELFKKARQNAPCIIFIDEIDVLGGRRSGFGTPHDQTLNQLLIEMDGFAQTSGIIVIAATNRADVLDSALLRPGRFDRKIDVDLPNVKDREAILKLHAQNKKLASDVNFHQLAKQTQGMSGAELASVLNEASILTARGQKTIITMDELQEAIDRIWFGPAKKSKKYTEKEKRETAYHEAGHAVICLKLPDAPKMQKITIIPRGGAGGYVLMMAEEELFFSSKKRLQADIVCSLAGRAAEEMMFGDENISNGCYMDFKQATKVARIMVTKVGMSDVGLMQDDEFANKKEINKAMKKIIDQSYKQAQTILQENKDLLDKIANLLLEQETITKEEIDKLV